eukprot:TRINITY_DN14943_c0_g2_i1.p1 TRINITY_DN14943_c0_g2~~TRINITY_DN14943_c0_g2_i1.p1  ORF type:complete len:108 (-),score=0.85 TRINITY_DN14943_c0_g2_i1:337-660(-)
MPKPSQATFLDFLFHRSCPKFVAYVLIPNSSNSIHPSYNVDLGSFCFPNFTAACFSVAQHSAPCNRAGLFPCYKKSPNLTEVALMISKQKFKPRNDKVYSVQFSTFF